MPRVVSFIVLLAILLLMGAVFFQVMAHFVVPLFLAAVLVVVFKPLHTSVAQQLPGPRTSALATTLLILLAVLLPTVWLGWKAAVECRDVYESLSAKAEARERNRRQDPNSEATPADAATASPVDDSRAEVVSESTNVASVADSTVAEAKAEKDGKPTLRATLVARVPVWFKDVYASTTGRPFSEDTVQAAIDNARGVIGSVAVSGAQIAVKLVFGLVIMVLALYYFLADGPKMLQSMMKLSPLDDVYERELLDKFANISRAVVVASLASAVAQGLLAGLGYAFALDAGAPIFLLTMLTMVLAIVPFAGAAAVWAPTVVWIYLYQPVYENGKVLLDAAGDPVRGDTFTAVCLAIYGVCVVSAIDNVIKPLVLHGQSNLHPLVALISILGGVQTLGPIGILVGPMLVAFIQALLNMINKELLRLGDGSLEAKQGSRGVPLPLGAASTATEAEAAATTGGSVADKIATAVTITAEEAAEARSSQGKSAKGPRAKRPRRKT